MPVDQIGVRPRATRRLAGVSLVLRRTHMYVALFLTPWMTMYALSTIVFNHNGLFQGDRYERQREISYTRAFDEDTPAESIAGQISKDLQTPHRLELRDTGDDTMVFVEHNSYTPLRVTYNSSKKTLLVEKQAFRLANFLTYLHSRVGYGRSHASVAWAISVDLTIAASVIWILSGFWMWWELKVTRRWGTLFALAGPAIFALIWCLG